MLLNDGNVNKKFQPSILNKNQENHIPPICLLWTDGQTDGHLEFYTNIVASLLKMQIQYTNFGKANI